ncbi:MAG: anti-sigma factor domain-containing protein, partial [Candidatus Limnocylindria bacterium]
LAAAVLALAAIDVAALNGLREARAERDRFTAIAQDISQAGRWWYMAGQDGFVGSGGTLIAPRRDAPPFVLFHDLRALEGDDRYTLWLVSAEGRWSRAASFRPDGRSLQAVELPRWSMNGYERCAVTIEPLADGPRRGAVIMESRIAPP